MGPPARPGVGRKRPTDHTVGRRHWASRARYVTAPGWGPAGSPWPLLRSCCGFQRTHMALPVGCRLCFSPVDLGLPSEPATTPVCPHWRKRENWEGCCSWTIPGSAEQLTKAHLPPCRWQMCHCVIRWSAVWRTWPPAQGEPLLIHSQEPLAGALQPKGMFF